jgi:hypothetical protein
MWPLVLIGVGGLLSLTWALLLAYWVAQIAIRLI